jgi:perosamine synthetase
MEELDEFIMRKQKNYTRYKELFEGFELGSMLEFRTGTLSNKWFYSLKIDKERVRAEMRDIVEALEKRGIGTRPIWSLLHEQQPYRNSLNYRIESAPYYSSCILNIPCSTNLTYEDIDFVVTQIKSVLEGFAEG